MDRVRARLTQAAAGAERLFSDRAASWMRSSTSACPRRSTFRSAARTCAPRIQRRNAHLARVARPSRGQRCAHSAGHRLPGAAAQYRSRARQRTRAERKGGGRQRHHGADFQRHDRAELLGRSEERQRLPADGAISGRLHPQPDGSASDAACAAPVQPLTSQLDTVSSFTHIESPTEVDHYQLRRDIDVYVSPQGRGPERCIARRRTHHPGNTNCLKACG